LGKADVDASKMIYDTAREDADLEILKMKSEIEDIREESKALGVLQKINYDSAHNDLLKYATLYQVRETKEYRKGGMTWEQFCEKIGESKRTVNDKLKDIRPLVENFQASLAHFSKVPFNKIRYLGRSVQADSAQIDGDTLLIDGVKISLAADNKEEITTAIDTLIETHKEEKQTLQKSLEKQKKKLDDNVKEETKGLAEERDHAIAARDKYKEEVDRLKPFDIAEKDVSWSVEHLENMHDICIKFTVAVKKFTKDERLQEDMTLQAKAEEQIFLMYQMIKDLRMDWDSEYYPNIED
jgi:hypothetical protein